MYFFLFVLDEVDCMSIYGHHKKHGYGYGYNEQVGGPGDTEPKSPGKIPIETLWPLLVEKKSLIKTDLHKDG